MIFGEMTWPLLRNVPRDRSIVLAPVAACEQHSRHLPTLTDTILVTAVAEGVECRLPDMVLLLPTLWLGASHHHLRFGATLSVDGETHVDVLCQLLVPLLAEGFLRFLVLNGHGGNTDTTHLALRSLQPDFPDRILSAAAYWELAEKELAALAKGPRKIMGHACEFETSMVMALRPELVHWEEIPEDPPMDDPAMTGLFLADDMKERTKHGAVGYPRLATPEKGKAFLEAAIQRTTEIVTALLKKHLPG